MTVTIYLVSKAYIKGDISEELGDIIINLKQAFFLKDTTASCSQGVKQRDVDGGFQWGETKQFTYQGR